MGGEKEGKEEGAKPDGDAHHEVDRPFSLGSARWAAGIALLGVGEVLEVQGFGSSGDKEGGSLDPCSLPSSSNCHGGGGVEEEKLVDRGHEGREVGPTKIDAGARTEDIVVATGTEADVSSSPVIEAQARVEVAIVGGEEGDGLHQRVDVGKVDKDKVVGGGGRGVG